MTTPTGATVVAPTPSLPHADDPEAVRSALIAHRAQVRQCYTRELRSDPALRGRMVVEFRVGTDGTTGEVHVRDDTVRSHRVRECVTHTVAAMRFAPAPSPSAKIRFPLVFEPHD